LDWLFSTNQLRDEHLKGSTIMETPVTPGINTNGKVHRVNNDDDDDEQNFYSAPPSRTFL
jgi:hypothetical protein